MKIEVTAKLETKKRPTAKELAEWLQGIPPRAEVYGDTSYYHYDGKHYFYAKWTEER